MIELIHSVMPYMFALLVGVCAGTLTGLIPGLHINLIAASLLSLTFEAVSETHIIIFIVALAVTHTFIDFIPSIFLGAASEDTITSILPGHKYLLAGQGYAAVKLTVIGSAIAIASLLIIIPVLFVIITYTYDIIERMMGFILAVTIFFLLSIEKETKLLAVIVFFCAGVLGTVSMNANLAQPLLPLLTGLFGASTIINSITTKTTIPKQKVSNPEFTKEDVKKPTILTMIISPLCSFLPGLGASQAATIASNMSKEKNDKEYLVLLGSINTLIITISFLTLYLVGRTRTGAANAISQITTLTPHTLFIILATIILTAMIAYPLTTIIAKQVAQKIHNIPYQKISALVLIGLTVLIVYFSGLEGFIIYAAATSLGLFTITNNVTRSHLMGAILLPTTLYYLPFF